MCRFFNRIEKRTVQWYSFSWVLVPVIMGCYYYVKNETEASNAFFAMTVGVISGTFNGYALRNLKKCPLAHVPENIEIQEQPGLPRNER